MPTVDEEFLTATKDFIGRQHKAGKPFFVWFNSTRMHIFTHLKKGSLGKTGKGIRNCLARLPPVFPRKSVVSSSTRGRFWAYEAVNPRFSLKNRVWTR